MGVLSTCARVGQPWLGRCVEPSLDFPTLAVRRRRPCLRGTAALVGPARLSGSAPPPPASHSRGLKICSPPSFLFQAPNQRQHRLLAEFRQFNHFGGARSIPALVVRQPSRGLACAKLTPYSCDTVWSTAGALLAASCLGGASRQQAHGCPACYVLMFIYVFLGSFGRLPCFLTSGVASSHQRRSIRNPGQKSSCGQKICVVISIRLFDSPEAIAAVVRPCY